MFGVSDRAVIMADYEVAGGLANVDTGFRALPPGLAEPPDPDGGSLV
jgi:hypothetical protein